MQIWFPLGSPLPKPTSVQVEHGTMFRCVGTYRTDGRIAVVTEKPQQPIPAVIGVLIQAMNAGLDKVTVKVTRSDGATIDVPFHFVVQEPRPKSDK
jgi:hypothetical protein